MSGLTRVATLVKIRCHRGRCFLGAVVVWGADETPTVFSYRKGQDSPGEGQPIDSDEPIPLGACSCRALRPLTTWELHRIRQLAAAALADGRTRSFVLPRPGDEQ